jgi:hypothetical protein
MVLTIRHHIAIAGFLILSLFCGLPTGLAQAEMTEPGWPQTHALQVKLVYAATPSQPYGIEKISPSFQDEILQEIRLYKALESLIQQLKMDLQVEGEESEAEILLEIPVEMTRPEGTEQPQLQLEFEIHPDTPQ